MVFRASDLVVSAVKKKAVSRARYAVDTCNCCETIQTCKSCTQTSPPSTCRPPTTFCGGTLTVSLRTLKALRKELDSVLNELYRASGASGKGKRKSKSGARKKK